MCVSRLIDAIARLAHIHPIHRRSKGGRVFFFLRVFDYFLFVFYVRTAQHFLVFTNENKISIYVNVELVFFYSSSVFLTLSQSCAMCVLVHAFASV